jgi:hypothetical protein
MAITVTGITLICASAHFGFEDRIVELLQHGLGLRHSELSASETQSRRRGYVIEVCESRLLGHVPLSA